MANTRVSEFEGEIGNEFSPYDDSREEHRYIVAAIGAQDGPGYDTSEYDRFRQGVEITSPKYLYGSTQPKMWAGNLRHNLKIGVYGQARTWVEFDDSITHNDRLDEFNPTAYIQDPEAYPSHEEAPLYFNEGPQQEEEAIIEPLTIPFRKSPQEGAHPVRSVKSSLEDGNPSDDFLLKSTNRILQFVEYARPITPRWFLDAGQGYFGSDPALSGDHIVLEGYASIASRQGAPFNDMNDELIVQQVNVGNTTMADDTAAFLTVLKALHMELDEDIRDTYNQKSATAGYDTYGPQAARTGTDSIAYVGTIRGG